MEDSQGSRKAILLVLLVFVLGVALGAMGTYVVTTRVLAAHTEQPVHNPANTVAKFTRQLSLTPDQQTRVMAILSDTRARYAAIHKKDDPEYEQTRQQGRDKIRQVLTPEQEPIFEEMLLKIDADRRKREGQSHPQ